MKYVFLIDFQCVKSLFKKVFSLIFTEKNIPLHGFEIQKSVSLAYYCIDFRKLWQKIYLLLSLPQKQKP